MLRTQEERDKAVQTRKANQELFDKYVAKLDEDEKAGLISREGQPYYLQKVWLYERGATLLDLWMCKPLPGAEDWQPQLVIYPHEAAKILKKSLRAAQRVLKEIRELNNIPPRVAVPMKEFCNHQHLDEEKVKIALVS